MAIDTRDKRASALREGLLPLPDGLALNQGDRQQVLWQYRGIRAAGPSVSGGDSSARLTVSAINTGGTKMVYGSSGGIM